MTDWLDICRASVADVQRVLVELPTRVEREPVLGQGLGGDDTTAIDKAAEDAILARFRPIDGSLNAKRGIPFFSVSIAVAEGPTMGDVHFGYVYDFGTGEEWIGERGKGATLNGERLVVRPKDTIEILSFEATLTSLVARDATKVAELAYRLRIMGSLALSLCHLAAGRVDAVCSLKAARTVDIAAAQLLVREAGLAIELFDDARSFAEAELDLEGRSRIAAAGTPELCRALADALSA